MVRHWSADQIGSFSWFGLSRIKEAGDPIRPGCVPGSNAAAAPDQGTMRQRGSCSGQEHRTLMQCEAALLGFTQDPLPEKEQCIMIGSRKMAQLHTPAEAAEILRIRESWLRAKAAARAIPCTFIGKHLRFSDDDIAQIMADGARQPVTRGRGTRR